MQQIPLNSIPNQTINVQLAGQSCALNVYQKSTGLYMDVLVNDVLIIGGVICENLNRIVRSLYLGFIGDFAFVDTQGSNDPYYTGIGTRYYLLYFSPSELPPLPFTPGWIPPVITEENTTPVDTSAQIELEDSSGVWLFSDGSIINWG